MCVLDFGFRFGAVWRVRKCAPREARNPDLEVNGLTLYPAELWKRSHAIFALRYASLLWRVFMLDMQLLLSKLRGRELNPGLPRDRRKY